MPSDEAARTALLDIAENIHLAQNFTRDMTYESFRNNMLVFYAATRCLEIISEASRRIAPAIKESHPNIPWADIAGAGNIYRYNYEGGAAPRLGNYQEPASRTACCHRSGDRRRLKLLSVSPRN